MNTNQVEGESSLSPICENVVKSKPKARVKKRKRLPSSSDEDVLPENAFEVERKLQESALKNNLDEASVKKILKKVVTNDHVLALVKLREEEEEESSTDENLRPKLTRAKAKELRKVSPRSAPWNLELTPIKHIPVKTRPEVKALIAQELPEDEDDEEYEPTHDDVPSDDDHVLESSSDFDSQPPTPATPKSDKKTSPKIVNDGPFKVPQEVSQACRKLSLEEEEATIARRTRSKLSLSATSIEHIESSFVPPDDLPMPDVDNLWNDFLKDCLNPASNTRNEDDDEADPEYNVAADPDAVDEDEEGLENSIIKISKKELNDLVTELFNIMPEPNEPPALDTSRLNESATAEGSDSQLLEPTGLEHTVSTEGSTQVVLPVTHWEGKQEPKSDEEIEIEHSASTVERQNHQKFSIGKCEPGEVEKTQSVENNVEGNATKPWSGPRTVKMSMSEAPLVERETVRPPPPLLRALAAPPDTLHVHLSDQLVVKPHQIQILQQQLRQHIQISAINFMQLYVHPIHWARAPQYKEYLETLYKLGVENPKSVVNVCNLKPAWELILSWEQSLSETTPENTKMIEFVAKEVERHRRRLQHHNLSFGEFPRQLMSAVANSTSVFLYPALLPAVPFRPDAARRCHYLRSEDRLIVLAIDQFWNYVEANPDLFPPPKQHPRRRWGLTTAVSLACKLLFTGFKTKMVLSHISAARKANDPNCPIAKYFKDGTVEPVTHKLLPYNPELSLYEQSEYEVPRRWVKYLAQESKRFRSFYYRPALIPSTPPSVGVEINADENVVPPKKKRLPIDFTKTITRRSNKSDEIMFQDKFNIIIEPAVITNNQTSTITATIEAFDMDVEKSNVSKNLEISNVQTSSVNTQINTVTTNIETSSNKTAVTNVLTQNHFSVTNSSDGVIKEQTNTVSSVASPICSSKETNISHADTKSSRQRRSVVKNVNSNLCNKSNRRNSAKNSKRTKRNKNKSDTNRNVEHSTSPSKQSANDGSHCECCILLRKISKVRQTIITEYFTPRKSPNCPCREMKYPKMSNKLRLLIRLYQCDGKAKLDELYDKIETIKKHVTLGEIDIRSDADDKDDFIKETKDFAMALAFQTKLTIRINNSKNPMLKFRLHRAFNTFDMVDGDVINLSNDVFKILENELSDLFNEFVWLLTPEQAEKLGYYKDYFIGNHFENLLKKIKKLVPNRLLQHELLTRIKSIFYDKNLSSCDMCANLISCMNEFPDLARYTFKCFPHTKRIQQEYQTHENKIDKETHIANQETHIANQESIVNEEIVRSDESRSASEERLQICDDIHSADEVENSSSLNIDIQKENTNEIVNNNLMKRRGSDDRLERNTIEKVTDIASSTRNESDKIPRKSKTIENATNNQLNTRRKSKYSLRKAKTTAKVADNVLNPRNEYEKILKKNNISENYSDSRINPNEGLSKEENSGKMETRYKSELKAGIRNVEGENAMDYEDDSSSTSSEEHGEQEHDAASENEETGEHESILIKTIKYEPIDTPDLTISNTDVQENTCTEGSIVITLEKTIKTEPPEWRRDEDKLILEMLKENLSPEQRKDQTIIDFIQNQEFLKTLASNLTDKSLDDIMHRVFYLLQLLVLDER